ncbi:MAG: carbohydrate-binding domain-containing protein [Anaerolineae bacterium]|nr:carbohydrate-binding domain-containing protein [Anaerolineae bacterium]
MLLLTLALGACWSVDGIGESNIGQTPTTGLVEPTAVTTAVVGEAIELPDMGDTHNDEGDYTWDDGDVVAVALNGDAIAVEGAGVVVDGSVATITAAGSYRLSGSLADGQIIVDSADDGAVRLILDGVDIRNSTSAAIKILNAEKALIVLADGSENFISDGETYVYDDVEAEEPNAAIFSKADLTIFGEGTLTVNGNFNDGIASKDGLVIAGGKLVVTAQDDGIRGKDYLVFKAGEAFVTSVGDGMTSDNETDADKGYITIASGVIEITSGGDAIAAQTAVVVVGGNLTLTTGGGSQGRIDETTSAKGIKGLVGVVVDGGTFVIDSADDAIHTNGDVTINSGDFTLSTGDDGMHADATLTINGGHIAVLRSYEGIESAVITLNAGDIYLVASDDGINVAGGVDGSGMGTGRGFGGMPVGTEGTPVAPGGGPREMAGTPMAPGEGFGGMSPGGAGRDMFAARGDYHLYINGGTVVVDAEGDGIDANGSVEMNDGLVIVNGPTQQMNGALDYIGGFKMMGGTLVAAGSAGMAQAPDDSSSQNVVMINFIGAQAAGDLVRIQDGSGASILTFAPSKTYQSIVFSSPALASGATYDIYLGGSSSASAADGLYQDGTYTPGSQYANFTVAETITMLGGERGGRP